MPLRFCGEFWWTRYAPTPIPYEDAETEPEPTYSFIWPHRLIHEVNVLILSKAIDPLKAIQIVKKRHLKKKQNGLETGGGRARKPTPAAATQVLTTVEKAGDHRVGKLALPGKSRLAMPLLFPARRTFLL